MTPQMLRRQGINTPWIQPNLTPWVPPVSSGSRPSASLSCQKQARLVHPVVYFTETYVFWYLRWSKVTSVATAGPTGQLFILRVKGARYGVLVELIIDDFSCTWNGRPSSNPGHRCDMLRYKYLIASPHTEESHVNTHHKLCFLSA